MNNKDKLLITFIEQYKRLCKILLEYFDTERVTKDMYDYLSYYSKADVKELIDNLSPNQPDIKDKIMDLLAFLLLDIGELYKKEDLYYKGYVKALNDVKDGVEKL